MKTIKTKEYKTFSGLKIYRMIEFEPTDKEFSWGLRYAIESQTFGRAAFENKEKAEKYFEQSSSVLNWL